VTEFKTSDRDVNRAIRSWLHENRHEDVSRVAGAVLDQVDTIPQRRATWWPARRTPEMNKILTIGLGTAAVIAALVIGIQLFGSPSGRVGGSADSTATPEPSIAPPSRSADVSLSAGPIAWFEPAEPGDGPPVTITIPASGWNDHGGFVWKGEFDGGSVWLWGDLPQSALLVTSTTAGITVYEDPCQWENNVPDPPARTAEEVAAALAAQPSRDASDPVAVTVGGYPGLEITLHVPDVGGFDDSDGFTDCYRNNYASYTPEGWGAEGGGSLPGRVHQGPGQIDTFWIVEVDGAIVIIDAMYRADTPADVIDEMRVIAESAIFELP